MAGPVRCWSPGEEHMRDDVDFYLHHGKRNGCMGSALPVTPTTLLLGSLMPSWMTNTDEKGLK